MVQEFDRGRAQVEAAVAPYQVILLQGVQSVPTPRGLAHHGDGRVLMGLERVQRVDDKGEVHGAWPKQRVPPFYPAGPGLRPYRGRGGRARVT